MHTDDATAAEGDGASDGPDPVYLEATHARAMAVAELRDLLHRTMNVRDPNVRFGTREESLARIRAAIGAMSPLALRAVLANAYLFVRSSYSEAALHAAFDYAAIHPQESVRAFFVDGLIPPLDAAVARLDRMRED